MASAPKNRSQSQAKTATAAPGASTGAEGATTPPSQESGPEDQPGVAIEVSVRPGLERRCRAARCFGAAPTVIPLAELRREQIEALVADPMLVIAEHKPGQAGAGSE
jgi:hypothetical protein